jgi:hypothetical protein
MVRCRGCGEVIGVYEPIVVLVDGDARQTSLAASDGHDFEGADCYHRACYRVQHEDAPMTGR